MLLYHTLVNRHNNVLTRCLGMHLFWWVFQLSQSTGASFAPLGYRKEFMRNGYPKRVIRL